MWEPTQQQKRKAALLGSLLTFTSVFYKYRTNRDFIFPHPTGREPHVITVCRALTDVFYLKIPRLTIQLPPGHWKSTLVSYFVAWAYAHHSDCQFIYISYGQTLAAKHTENIRGIMQLPQYVDTFDVTIDKNSSAKDDFKTSGGGRIKAFGSSGSITGQDAGLPGLERFSGCVIMDDMHKPDEAHSDVTRIGVIRNYNETVKPRPRGNNVPIVSIGQRVHEEDLAAHLMSGNDGYTWHPIILKGLDENGNALCDEAFSKERLLIESEHNKYVFASQYQQNPIPASGGLYQKSFFDILDLEPDILKTFIVIDTAETSKTFNDATVFSFFGIYKIKDFGADTDIYGLHFLECNEIWIEPKDLESAATQFIADCMRHKVKPDIVAIEKKSTGTTLVSVLKDFRGVRVIEIERNAYSGSKTDRFIKVQPYLSRRLLTFPINGYHTQNCIKHLTSITANDSHARDDIADTVADAVNIALIDKTLLFTSQIEQKRESDILKSFAQQSHQITHARKVLWQ